MNRKISLCYVVTQAFVADWFFLEPAKYLLSTGEYEVTFICTQDDSFLERLPEGMKYYAVELARGMKVSPFAISKLYRIFRNEGFDIVQYSASAGVYASIAAWLAKIPVRINHQFNLVHLVYSGIKRRIIRKAEKMICSFSTHIRVVSEQNLRYGLKARLYASSKCGIVWNGSSSGIDLERFDLTKKEEWRKEKRIALALPMDSYVVGFVGRIDGDKGFNELLQAMQILAKENTFFCVVGPLDKPDSIDKSLYLWARESSNVRFTGMVYDVERYYSVLDCLALPSYREGFGNVLIEAGAMAIPTIATGFPGPGDAFIPEETGIEIPMRDSDAIIDAVRRLRSDPVLSEKMGKAGRIFAAERFDNKVLYSKIKEDYEQCFYGGK